MAQSVDFGRPLFGRNRVESGLLVLRLRIVEFEPKTDIGVARRPLLDVPLSRYDAVT
jgi:hypothetical protein